MDSNHWEIQWQVTPGDREEGFGIQDPRADWKACGVGDVGPTEADRTGEPMSRRKWQRRWAELAGASSLTFSTL